MRALLLLMKWELLEFRKSKVLVFWNLLFPLLLFLVLVTAFGRPSSLGSVQMSLVDRDGSTASALFDRTIREVFTANEGVAGEFVRPGAPADVTLTIPKGFEAALAGGAPAHVRLDYDGSKGLAQRTAAQIVRSVATEFELRIRHGEGAVRLDSVDRSGGRRGLSYISFLATGILVLTLLSMCVMGIVIPLAARREYGVLRTFQSLPVSRTTYLAAFIGSRILLGLVLALTFLGLLSLLYDLNFALDLPRLAKATLLIILMAAVFAAIGLAVGGRLRSVAGATAAANLVFFPLVFLGNLTIPTSGFPPVLRGALDYTPSAIGASALRDTLIAGGPEGAAWQPIVLLALWGIAAAVLAQRLFVWNRR